MLEPQPTSSGDPSLILQMQGITKRFPGVVALDNVSFDVHLGEVHCVVGENGAGKSTLMKIMNGIYTEYEGQMLVKGHQVHLHSTKDAQERGFAMIHQELNLVPELRVYENIFLGREPHGALGVLQRRKMRQESVEWLNRLGVHINPSQPVRQLRIGARQLVEIAKALSLNAKILVMDEPTSALSETETQQLFTVIKSLKASGVAIIYISHRMDEIFDIADRITVLRDGRTISSRPLKDVTRAQLIKDIVGRDINEAFERPIAEKGEIALQIKYLSLRAPGVRTLDNISFELRRGEVLGLAGLMGAGRSEILETIFGVHSRTHYSGEIMVGGKPVKFHSPADAIRAGIGFVTEDRKGKSLIGGLPVRTNSTLAALHIFAKLLSVIDFSQEKRAVVQQVEDLDIRMPSIETPVSNLSGGNQQKVVISKFLLTQPSILLLDEPTRGIDVGAKSQIYHLVGRLAHQGTAFLLASSEMPELLAVCDRILVLCDGRITGEFTHAEATQEKILEAATRYLENSNNERVAAPV